MDAAKIDAWLASLDEIGMRIAKLVEEAQETISVEPSSEASKTLDACLDSYLAALDNLSAADKSLRTLR